MINSKCHSCAFLFFKFCICILDPCAVVRWHHWVYSLKVCFLLVHRSQLVPISNAHFFSRRVIYSSQYFCTLVSFCPVTPHILSAHISGGKFISILEEIWRKKYVFTVTEGWPNLLLEYFILKEFGIVNFSNLSWHCHNVWVSHRASIYHMSNHLIFGLNIILIFTSYVNSSRFGFIIQWYCSALILTSSEPNTITFGIWWTYPHIYVICLFRFVILIYCYSHPMSHWHLMKYQNHIYAICEF